MQSIRWASPAAKIPILRLQRRPSNRHVSRATLLIKVIIHSGQDAKASGAAIESLIKGRRTDRTLTGKRRPPLRSPLRSLAVGHQENRKATT